MTMDGCVGEVGGGGSSEQTVDGERDGGMEEGRGPAAETDEREAVIGRLSDELRRELRRSQPLGIESDVERRLSLSLCPSLIHCAPLIVSIFAISPQKVLSP